MREGELHVSKEARSERRLEGSGRRASCSLEAGKRSGAVTLIKYSGVGQSRADHR